MQMGKIALVNQWNNSSNGTTSCSLTMTGCTVGNTLILAYAVRGEGNDPSLSDGWIKMGGGNNVDTSDNLNQRLYFAYKNISSTSDAITLTQTSTGRIYLVCAEFSGIQRIEMRDDLSKIGTSNYTVSGTKSSETDVMLYGITSAYYDSGRNQSVDPSDLTKIQGDSSAERLACWFDGGDGSISHTFKSTSLSEEHCAVLECVQLFDTAPLPPDPPTPPHTDGKLYEIDIAGVKYGESDILSVTVTQPLFERLSVGNACSAELKIRFIPKGIIPRMAEITPYARKSETDDWFKIGTFYTDTRTLTGDMLEITAYDKMLRAEQVWEPDPFQEFPMTMPDVVTELSGLMGVEVDTRTVLNSAYTVGYPAHQYTIRDMLRYVAAAHGGNWIITADGKLLLVPLFGMPTETNYLVSDDGDSITFGGVRITVG